MLSHWWTNGGSFYGIIGYIATVQHVKNTLNFSFKYLQLKNELGAPNFVLSHCDRHDKM